MAATEAQLRILLDDPAGAGELLSTAQYTAIIAIESNVYRAAALGARSIAAQFAEKVSVKAGPVAIENQQKYKAYMSLAEAYDFRADEGGGGANSPVAATVHGVSISAMDSVEDNTDRYRPNISSKFGDYERSPLPIREKDES